MKIYKFSLLIFTVCGLAATTIAQQGNMTSLNLPNSVFMQQSQQNAQPQHQYYRGANPAANARQAQRAKQYYSRAAATRTSQANARVDWSNRIPMVAGGQSPQAMQQYAVPPVQPTYSSPQYMPQRQQYQAANYSPQAQQQPYYPAMNVPYRVESSINNQHLMQRNSAISGQAYPYRNNPRFVSPGYHSGQRGQVKATDGRPQGVDPSLYKILKTGTRNTEYIKRSQQQYGHQSNWLNRLFRVPTRQMPEAPSEEPPSRYPF